MPQVQPFNCTEKNVVLKISAVSHDGIEDAKFDTAFPRDLSKYRVQPSDWTCLIEEANNVLRFDWYPRLLWWSLLCCIPFLLDDHNKAITRRGKALVKQWNEQGRLPSMLVVHFTTEKVATTRHGSGSRKGVAEETLHSIEICKKQ
uniref:Uncharacterized protein n=1 Tax=Tetraselmis sp. GSL018 TaxID=582737 RepID=A0A061RYH3_9CHLO